jgi:hypothetical protein
MVLCPFIKGLTGKEELNNLPIDWNYLQLANYRLYKHQS